MTVETTTDHATLDAIVADLNVHAGDWVALPFTEKGAMLERLRPRILAEADAMVRETQRAKGIDVLSIPHNANGSNGTMYERTKWNGQPVDKAWADNASATSRCMIVWGPPEPSESSESSE